MVGLRVIEKCRSVAQAVHHTTLTDGDQNIKKPWAGQLSGDNGANPVDQHAGFDVEGFRHITNNIFGFWSCKLL